MRKCDTEYTNKQFADICCKDSEFKSVNFENCNFINCNFDNSLFKKCKFSDCNFKSCSINLVKLLGSSFLETDFLDCKMKGINWTEMYFPYVTLSSPIFFKNCDISYSSFYELKLPGVLIINCKAHETDFRFTDMSHSDLCGTDFEGSQFNKTNLKSADLRGSINYQINPIENTITGAHFNFPEAANLLAPFKIKIDDFG